MTALAAISDQSDMAPGFANLLMFLVAVGVAVWLFIGLLGFIAAASDAQHDFIPDGEGGFKCETCPARINEFGVIS